MDDRKLDVLLSAIRTGSFSKAAKETNITQSAITQMMDAMEKELGCRILNRSHKGVSLTEAGEQLLPQIVEADAALSRLSRRAKEVALGDDAPIRIGTFSSIANNWLPSRMKTYQDQNPGTTFTVHVGTSQLRSWLLDGDIDLALGNAERCKGFRWHPIMEDPYRAVLPPDMLPEVSGTITQEQLLKQRFTMSTTNDLERYFTKLPAESIVIDADDDATLLSIVRQGIGATAMPQLCLEQKPTGVRILNLEPTVYRTLGFALSNNPSRQAERFAEFLEKSV